MEKKGGLMLTGKKTYILGIVMVLHGAGALYLDFQNKQPLNQINLIEILNGLGFIFLRQAVS